MELNQSNRARYRFKITFETEMQQVTKAELASLISKITNRVIIISDLIFMKRHAVFFRGLPKTLPVLQVDIQPNTKNIQDLNHIYEYLLQENVDRNTSLIVFGGGTLTDLAAFAASTFKRGIKLILVPTTVVGMVDASLGGKSAYDMHHLKNMIGTFYPAVEVYFCQEFLKTLKMEDILNGWAEIVKMFLIDQTLELPEMLDLGYLPPKDLIWETAKLKMTICTSDLQDKEGRRLLNLGHTFAHVLESITLCEIPHGIAVVFGIHAAAVLSHRLGRIDELIMHRIRNLFLEFPLSDYVTEDLINNILSNGLDSLIQDKKADNGLKLVLFKGWREVEVVDIAEPYQVLTSLVDVLKEYLAE
jgi:3-dehydroquinate synthetase